MQLSSVSTSFLSSPWNHRNVVWLSSSPLMFCSSSGGGQGLDASSALGKEQLNHCQTGKLCSCYSLSAVVAICSLLLNVNGVINGSISQRYISCVKLGLYLLCQKLFLLWVRDFTGCSAAHTAPIFRLWQSTPSLIVVPQRAMGIPSWSTHTLCFILIENVK